VPKILIAEDEPAILRVLAMWLTRNGFEVFEACDGVEALAIIDSEPLDVIISDVNMPRLDGLELVRLLREERHAQTPYILLSARSDQARLAEMTSRFGVHLYPKPFVPSRLVADIQALLAAAASPNESLAGRSV
jgi:DNA-binding response OmpR family regulator